MGKPCRCFGPAVVVYLVPLFFFLLSYCGGPKKIIFNINGQIKRPEGISEDEYKRISPILSKVSVNVLAEVSDEEGRLIERRTSRANIYNDRFSSRLDFTVDDLSQDVKIKVGSERFIIFSRVVFSDKFEKVEDLNFCQGGDLEEYGYDYMCVLDFTVVPEFSESIKNYIEFRERLMKAEERLFCSVYVTVSQAINELQPEIREFAVSDVADFYNSFVDRIRTNAMQSFDKIRNRNCADRGYLERIKGYFCLPENLLDEVRRMIRFCDAYSLYDEGLALLRKGQTTKAFDKFRESIKIKPDFSDSYVAIGDIYFDEKRYEDARDMYLKALEYSKSVSVYEKLGDTYMKMNLFEAADEAYRKALDIGGESATHTIFYKRAFALKRLSRWEQAADPIRRAIDIINSLPEVKYDRDLQKKLALYYTLLGETYIKLQRVEEGKRSLEEALTLDPYGDEALFLLAEVYSVSDERSDLKKAKDYYEKLFALGTTLSKNGEIWYRYAVLLEGLQEDESQILFALEKTVKFSPENDQAYLKLAKIYERRKGYEKVAEEMYRKAYENSKRNTEKDNFMQYIDFLFRQGNYAVAKRVISDHLLKHSGDKDARRMYNEASLMLYIATPQSLKRLGLSQKMLDEIYIAFSSVPPDLISEITEIVGVSKEFFLRLDPYKRMILVIAYMDNVYGVEGKGAELQKAERYKDMFGKTLGQPTIGALSKMTSQKLGISFK